MKFTQIHIFTQQLLQVSIIPQRQHSSIATQQQAVAMARSDGHVVEATGELGHLLKGPQGPLGVQLRWKKSMKTWV
jgi:hypothetical protein